MERSLRIALLGTRGIPACYGGFETFAEQISRRLAARGHIVTVYGRRRFGAPTPDEMLAPGVISRHTPTIFHKYLETPVHACTSNVTLRRSDVDVALLCNAANSPFAWMVRAKGIPLVINVDGIERERAKWNAFGRLWYRLGEWASVRFASKVVGDAEVISRYYADRYGCDAAMIPYGAEAIHVPPGDTLRRFGLLSRRYLLYVSRLEPENNALGVIEAYRSVATEVPLVIVGDAPYADAYKAKLRSAADARVIFTGFQFGEAYRELQSHALLYIQATEVGGTHPALIESMSYGNCIVANGTPENIEVLGDAGVVYAKNDFRELGTLLTSLIADDDMRSSLGQRAATRAAARYSWDAVTSAYEALFFSLV